MNNIALRREFLGAKLLHELVYTYLTQLISHSLPNGVLFDLCLKLTLIELTFLYTKCFYAKFANV